METSFEKQSLDPKQKREGHQKASKNKISFSPEQEKIIHHWGSGLSILAGAGAGKTTTLVAKCLELFKKKPDAKLIAISFTERSASDLKSKLAKSFIEHQMPQALSSCLVMTIHGLCSTLIRDYPSEAGIDGEESVLSESEALRLWEQIIDSLWFDELPGPVLESVERLLERESRSSLNDLFQRIRDLNALGVLEKLNQTECAQTRDLSTVSHYLMGRYERSKNRQGALDFSDLERFAYRVVQSKKVQESLHRQFDLILVDEFQDTNPVQAEIVWKLAKPDLSNLCVVGDPKQSIYRFRDADVASFVQHVEKLPAQYQLTHNYRSQPRILDFVNASCQIAFEGSEIPFVPLVASRKQNENQESVISLCVEAPGDLGRWILEQNKNGIPIEDMALLVRRVRGNEKWLRGLRDCGISIALGSGGLFWSDPRIKELVAFLRWWDFPDHRLSAVTALRSPWIGVSDQQIDRWAGVDRNFQASFFGSDHPIAQYLKPLKSSPARVRPGEVLEALLGLSDANLGSALVEPFEEMRIPLLGLWHRVEDLSSRGLEFHEVVVELSRCVEEGRRESLLPAPRGLGQLQVLTLHGSKGLEFKHVILIDFEEKPRTSNAPLLFWDRKRGIFFGKRTAGGQRSRTDKEETQWRSLEKEKSISESKRLFYVALTRAQERLILVLPKKQNASAEDKISSVERLDYWRGWVEKTASLYPQLSVNIQAPDGIETKKIVSQKRKEPKAVARIEKPALWKRERHSVTEWVLFQQCKRAYEWTYLDKNRSKSDELVQAENRLVVDRVEVPSTPSEVVSFDSSGLLELGKEVHRLLEREDCEGIFTLERTQKDLALCKFGGLPFKSAPLLNWVKTSPYMKSSSRFGGGEVYSELKFEVGVANEVLVGTMDRLVVRETKDGLPEAYLIDFKFSIRAPKPEVLLKRYQMQMELYAYALTQLDSRFTLSQVRPIIVSISNEKVVEVVVPVGVVEVEDLAQKVSQLVNQTAQRQNLGSANQEESVGSPQVGFMCRYCSFLERCPEGKGSLQV